MDEVLENIAELIEVFIKINEQKEIIEVASSVFLKNREGWIKIDEGYGDKYAHAQSHYFEKPFMDENGNYQYKYEK